MSGKSAHDGFEARDEIFIKGTEPGEDTVHVKLKLCRNEGKLATPSDIAGSNYEEKEFFVFKEEDPTAGTGPNRWQEGILAWLQEQTDPRYHPPTDYCAGVNAAPLNVEFVSPRDRDSNLGDNLTIKFTVDAINEIELASLEIDSIKVRSFTKPPYEHEVTLPDGVHTLRAIAKDKKGNESERIITIGIGTAWNATPTPSPSP